MVNESHSGLASESSKAPRLFIKEMVMRNFKSYAGEQRVGPFHKSCGAQWEWQEQCNRRYVICIWKASKADET
ncbi:hypothetical protein MANES_11G018150v8 [Manihot esculenta]|uniref:Uncharacterized protein n=1 Tax=Manihot esculenta TaxID=3983 RepID=A0ACB7GSU0_MANES|nr:hypothetical protein MANES_11G018150v8 [Manihot esculenta]